MTSQAQSSCLASTVSNCSVGGLSHAAYGGRCAAGYSGACSYSCNDGSWVEGANSCTARSGGGHSHRWGAGAHARDLVVRTMLHEAGAAALLGTQAVMIQTAVRLELVAVTPIIGGTGAHARGLVARTMLHEAGAAEIILIVRRR